MKKVKHWHGGFLAREGQPAYDCLEDMKKKRVDITCGQLLQLSSIMRWHWQRKRVRAKMSDTRVVQLHKVNDISLVVDACIWMGEPKFVL